MSGAQLSVANVVKQYADHRALDGVSLEVKAGSYTVILGPSGSGKTTLLAILGGFAQPTSGRIEVDGQDVTTIAPAKRPTTTVFQDYALFPHMSVGQNVGFGLEMKRVSKADRSRRVRDALDMVGLGHTIDRHIAELSGGQRQRIALARALIVEPRVLLLDEPLGALDLKLRRQMQDELTSIHRRVGTTFIHVTHDQEEAMSLADTIVILRDGRIEDMGSPERLYLDPATAFSAKFMGDSNVTDGIVRSSSGGVAGVETPWGTVDVHSDATVGSSVTVSIRPEHVLEGDRAGGNLGSWQVTEAHFLGQRHRITVERDGQQMLVSLPQESHTRNGDQVTLGVLPGNAKVVKGDNQ
jgi:spermidine/putrescine transport system ATP-binding protein